MRLFLHCFALIAVAAGGPTPGRAAEWPPSGSLNPPAIDGTSSPAVFLNHAMMFGADANAGGNICLVGTAHFNGIADFGPQDVRLKCGGTYTDGFIISPPYVYTDPGHFPDATYYDVRAHRIAGVDHARIFTADGIDITWALGDSLTDVISYDSGTNSFTYAFDDPALMVHYFDEIAGVFKRAPGDVAAVVNFGGVPLADPPGPAGICHVVLDGSGSEPLHTTIVNTRFTGVLEEQRIDHSFWQGGLTMLKELTMEPYHGIALLVHDLMQVGTAVTQVGTEAWPALAYVTGDVVAASSKFDLRGSIIGLHDFNAAGANITYDDGFIDNLPDYLASGFEPAGACYFGDGSCEILAGFDCFLRGGAYAGDGTWCDPTSCTGACCLIDGCTVSTAQDCRAGGGFYLGPGSVCGPDPCGSIGLPDPSRTPLSLSLGLPAPNPSRGPIGFRFSVPQPGTVRVSVYDVRGRLVATLADRQFSAGIHDLAWDARLGRKFAQGVYYLRMDACGRMLSRRFVIIR